MQPTNMFPLHALLLCVRQHIGGSHVTMQLDGTDQLFRLPPIKSIGTRPATLARCSFLSAATLFSLLFSSSLPPHVGLPLLRFACSSGLLPAVRVASVLHHHGHTRRRARPATSTPSSSLLHLRHVIRASRRLALFRAVPQRQDPASSTPAAAARPQARIIAKIVLQQLSLPNVDVFASSSTPLPSLSISGSFRSSISPSPAGSTARTSRRLSSASFLAIRPLTSDKQNPSLVWVTGSNPRFLKPSPSVRRQDLHHELDVSVLALAGPTRPALRRSSGSHLHGVFPPAALDQVPVPRRWDLPRPACTKPPRYRD
nr:uncharacterized protein LOC127299175 isoform X1 [Lolium perenne]XP_051185056.1 uncharacterized protein LOC127299175 isoform X2 [Lolium perenne]XP_051185057.1 uncharacterized protein LOC127299175 isoform X3 [Lolium perenne]